MDRNWLGSDVGPGYIEVDGLVASDIMLGEVLGMNCEGDVTDGERLGVSFGVDGPGDGPGDGPRDPGVSMVAKRSEQQGLTFNCMHTIDAHHHR